MFKDEKTTGIWHSVMTSVLHAAQSSFDDSSLLVKFAWVTVLSSPEVSCTVMGLHAHLELVKKRRLEPKPEEGTDESIFGNCQHFKEASIASGE